MNNVFLDRGLVLMLWLLGFCSRSSPLLLPCRFREIYGGGPGRQWVGLRISMVRTKEKQWLGSRESMAVAHEIKGSSPGK